MQRDVPLSDLFTPTLYEESFEYCETITLKGVFDSTSDIKFSIYSGYMGLGFGATFFSFLFGCVDVFLILGINATGENRTLISSLEG